MTRKHRVMLLTPLLIAMAHLAIGATNGPGYLPMASTTQLLHRLAYDHFVIRSVKDAGGGVMGAKKVELQFDQEPTIIFAKWKATGSDGDSWNNSPRREIGVYAMQDFVVDPEDYLVPPTAARCIPLDTYALLNQHAAPTFDGTRCVFGDLSAWLEHVKQPDKVFDPERFANDSAYAERFAELNLLHYLVNHRDARGSNFLVPTDPADPRIFSIDNGIAFGGVLYNFFTWHFNTILVPLPHAEVDRLRRISRQDLDRLGVLGQLEPDGDGVLRNVTPQANVDPEHGVRRGPWGLQFGLTRVEIDAVAERLRSLLAKIDAGEQRVF